MRQGNLPSFAYLPIATFHYLNFILLQYCTNKNHFLEKLVTQARKIQLFKSSTKAMTNIHLYRQHVGMYACIDVQFIVSLVSAYRSYKNQQPLK